MTRSDSIRPLPFLFGIVLMIVGFGHGSPSRNQLNFRRSRIKNKCCKPRTECLLMALPDAQAHPGYSAEHSPQSNVRRKRVTTMVMATRPAWHAHLGIPSSSGHPFNSGHGRIGGEPPFTRCSGTNTRCGRTIMASRITRHPSIAPAHPGEQLVEIVISATGPRARSHACSASRVRRSTRSSTAPGPSPRPSPRGSASCSATAPASGCACRRPRRLGGRARDRRQRHSDPACEQIMSNADDDYVLCP
jgi:hypothetical protein